MHLFTIKQKPQFSSQTRTLSQTARSTLIYCPHTAIIRPLRSSSSYNDVSLYGIVANETMTIFLHLAPKSKLNDDVNTFDRELDLSYLLQFSCLICLEGFIKCPKHLVNKVINNHYFLTQP